MYANLFKNKIVVLATFTGAALILFSPSTGRIFLSDDYCTLNNIVFNHSIWLGTFFRPVGDLTLMWNYQLTGWDPFYFYLTNILLHAVNSFLLYLFCLKWYGRDNRSILFATAAGILFLTYPSHSEAILWAIGRGISLAVFFSLLAMIAVVSDLSSPKKYILGGIYYFLALACYESVVLLPVVLMFLYSRSPGKRMIRFGAVLAFTLAVHIFLRYKLTGGMWRAYNGVLFSKDLVEYTSAFVKIIFRMFIPAFNHPISFALCGGAALCIVFVVLYRNRRQIDNDAVFHRTILLVSGGIVSSIVVTLSFGMSTRTSEGDRFMYLPSVFYSIFIALLIVRLVSRAQRALLIVALVAIVQSAFTVINQNHWIRASEIAVKVINSIGVHPQRPIYIVNLPSDHKGAFIFRNCLPEALLHYKIDTSSTHVANIIQSTEIERKESLIVPEIKGSLVFIWPSTLLEMQGELVHSIKTGSDSAVVVNVPQQALLYWNKENLVSLKALTTLP